MRRRREAERPAQRTQQPASLRSGGAQADELGIIEDFLDARRPLRERLVQAEQPGMTLRRTQQRRAARFALAGAAGAGKMAVAAPAIGKPVQPRQRVMKPLAEQHQQRGQHGMVHRKAGKSAADFLNVRIETTA